MLGFRFLYHFCFCLFIIDHCVCRRHTTLQTSNTHEYTVRRQKCCVSRASGVIVVVSGSQRYSDWCALGCSAAVASGYDCVSHGSGWLTLVEVFAAFPLGVSRFLSCRVGGYFMARWNVGAQACARVSCCAGREPVAWVHMQLTRKSTFWGVLKTSARPKRALTRWRTNKMS